HARRAEVVDLPERGGEPLQAGGRLDEPRGEGDRELVRVPDAVPANEAFLVEEALEVESGRGGGEVGKPRLVAVRDVEVEEPRLERLLEGAPTPGHRAVEEQPRVEARCSQPRGAARVR